MFIFRVMNEVLFCFVLFSYFFITRFCLYLERAGSELPEVLALALAVSGSRTGTSAAL